MQILDVNNTVKDYGPYKEPIMNIVGVGGEIRQVAGFLPYFYCTFDQDYKIGIMDTLEVFEITKNEDNLDEVSVIKKEGSLENILEEYFQMRELYRSVF